eukprot:TRINITY_DN19370_c1_g1_i1.p1 TRINITY_DN19370_c1_g1~~TRINITY_DN19370_c1_g1_i1.p1  ORF type:complete len:301 (+),score=70.04 TRINITY_DN19370_c1_g1_i1:157-1059(+)
MAKAVAKKRPAAKAALVTSRKRPSTGIVKQSAHRSAAAGGAKRRAPPAAWRKDWPIIQELRRIKDAPVDSVGCERLADTRAPKKDYEWQCLVSAMLSSQTKDQMNAQAMQNLHGYGNTVTSIAKTPEKKLARLISMVGFHNTKAKHLKAAAKICMEEHKGRIPKTVEGLVQLPGVGPKMAHLTVHAAFDTQEGICVDTHVHRIANTLGWIKTKTAEDTRKVLEAWLPEEHWPIINIDMVGLGQQQQQQQQLLIERCLGTSSPRDALRLVSKIGVQLRVGKCAALDAAAARDVAIRRLLRR